VPAVINTLDTIRVFILQSLTESERNVLKSTIGISQGKREQYVSWGSRGGDWKDEKMSDHYFIAGRRLHDFGQTKDQDGHG
jgi:hypothetical protein